MGDLLRIFLIVCFVPLGVCHIVKRREIAAKSRRGTAARITPAVPVDLGTLWLALAALQLGSLLL